MKLRPAAKTQIWAIAALLSLALSLASCGGQAGDAGRGAGEEEPAVPPCSLHPDNLSGDEIVLLPEQKAVFPVGTLDIYLSQVRDDAPLVTRARAENASGCIAFLVYDDGSLAFARPCDGPELSPIDRWVFEQLMNGPDWRPARCGEAAVSSLYEYRYGL